MSYFIAVDQGTTSTRALVFDEKMAIVAKAQQEFKQLYPAHGWVEHDVETIWQTTLLCCREAMQQAELAAENILALGITNQRETTVVWNRHSGKAIANAIVWQDRRTAAQCQALQDKGHWIQQKTGLLLDPYFSATKLQWLLENVPGAAEAAAAGDLLFGTIDCYLLWRFSDGEVHATDISNASRTMLFNIHTQQWDDELLQLFQIPKSMLPAVHDNAGVFASTAKAHFGKAIPISGMAGDQQAAMIGQACLQPGCLKSTFGTGGFIMQNTGDSVVNSSQKLLSTVIYRYKKSICYGLEGSIFCAGATIKWLRDELKIIDSAAETAALAESVEDNGGVVLLPAFTGLGAPYWRADMRGALLGLTRNTQRAHIVRAALEAVVFQLHDLLKALQIDYPVPLIEMRVDGGMSANDWMLQTIADVLRCQVQRSDCLESSAKGAAILAALGVGHINNLAEAADFWQAESHFSPQKTEEYAAQQRQQWHDALSLLGIC